MTSNNIARFAMAMENQFRPTFTDFLTGSGAKKCTQVHLSTSELFTEDFSKVINVYAILQVLLFI